MPKIQVLDLRLAKEKTALLGVLLAAAGISSRLTDRQAAIARIYGHGSWAEMKLGTSYDTTDLTEIDEARAADALLDALGATQGQATNMVRELGVGDIRGRSARLLDRIVEAAHRAGTSDVHIKEGRSVISVMHRRGGGFEEVDRLPASDMEAIRGRLSSIGSGYGPAGGISSGEGVVGRHIPIRFHTTPEGAGPRTIAVRIMRRQSIPPLSDLGISNLRTLLDLLAETSGIVVFVGTTGAGKTWTTHSCALRLADEGRDVVTVEEYREYDLGIPSYRLDRREDMSQDDLVGLHGRLPDVVVLGDVTMTASRAALARDLSQAGVLVLCEIHGTSAVSGIHRLMDLELTEEEVLRHVKGAHYQFLVHRSQPARRAYIPGSWSRRPSRRTEHRRSWISLLPAFMRFGR